MATIVKPAMRPPAAMGATAVSYVKDLDDYFAANQVASGKLEITSNAQPAMSQPPPM